MPSRDPIRTYIPQERKAGPSLERGEYKERHPLPAAIRLFIWLLILRSGANLIFALVVGLAPDSSVAAFVSANFDAWPKQMPAEGVFYVSAFLYGLMAWRWATRDWRARWVVMFLSGATALKMLANFASDRAVGTPTPMSAGQQLSFTMSVGINLLICGYLAFYPGMAQAFKETPWE